MYLFRLPGWAQHFVTQLKPKTKFVQVTGAAANTNIAVAGIAAKDTPFVAYNVTDAGHVSVLPKVTSAGNIQFSVTTATKTVIVGYYVG